MYRLRKALIASGIPMVVAVWLWFGKLGFLPEPFCPLHRLTGIPCPGCGGTRAAMMLLDGHFFDALMINPLSLMLIVFLGVVAVVAWIDVVTRLNWTESLLKKRWPRGITITLCVLIAATWVRNIVNCI